MQVKLAITVALLPFLVQARPAPAISGTKIALTKRSSFAKDGVVSINALQSHVERVQA